MGKKIVSVLIASLLVFGIPATLVGCGSSSSKSSSTMTQKQKNDAVYSKKLMDSAKSTYGNKVK